MALQLLLKDSVRSQTAGKRPAGKGGMQMNTLSFGENPQAKKRVQGFQVLEDECIWMKAGVINFRKCDNNFDCNTCPFDNGMRKAMEIEPGQVTSSVAPGWAAHLKEKFDGASRPCRHTLTGRFSAPKICTRNYECYHCSFDQMLDDMDLTRETGPAGYRLASGYRMAVGYYYHPGHSWTRFEHGGRVRVGLDDFTVKVFGVPGSLDLPPLGEKLKQGQAGWRLVRNGHAAAIQAPVTGTVLALNHRAWEHPEIIDADPYHQGWLMIMEPAMPKRNLKELYYGQASMAWMEKEVQKLLGLMGSEYEQLAATGAEPIKDVFRYFPEIGWDSLVQHFLRPGKVTGRRR